MMMNAPVVLQHPQQPRAHHGGYQLPNGAHPLSFVPLNHPNFQMLVGNRHRIVPILPMPPPAFSDEDEEERTLVSSISMDDSLVPKYIEPSSPMITYDQFLEELMSVAHQGFVPPTEVVIPVRHQQIFRPIAVGVEVVQQQQQQPQPQGAVLPVIPQSAAVPASHVVRHQQQQQQQQQVGAQPQLQAPSVLHQTLPTAIRLTQDLTQPGQTSPCPAPPPPVAPTTISEQLEVGAPTQRLPLDVEIVSFWSLSPDQTKVDEQVLGQRRLGLVGKAGSGKLSNPSCNGKSSFNTAPTSSSSSTGGDHVDATEEASPRLAKKQQQQQQTQQQQVALTPSMILEELPPKLQQIRRRQRKDIWRKFSSPLRQFANRRPSMESWPKMDWKQAFGSYA